MDSNIQNPASPQVTPMPQKRQWFLPIFLSVLFLLLVCSTAYFAYQDIQLQKQITQLTQAQTSVPTPISSPTANPTANWKTYIDSSSKYSFKYPSNDWLVNVLQTSVTLTCETCNENSKNPQITIFMPLNENTIEDRKKWLNEAYGISINDKKVVEIDETVFNGMPVIIDYDHPTTQSPGSYHVFVSSNKRGYIIGTLKKPSQGSIIDQILSTFKFMDAPSGATYTCPPGGYVDCMPVLTPEKQKACSTDAMTWYKANCPDFKGGAL